MERILAGCLSLILTILCVMTGPGGLEAGSSTTALAPPAEPYIRRGACPGEGCTLGKWVLTAPVVVYERPDRSSRIVGRLEAKQGVTAEVGEIHTLRIGVIRVTRPVRLEMDEAVINLRPGDVVYELEYLGEGSVSVWYQGRKLSGWAQPEEGWGVRQTPRETDWWARIRRTSDGLSGWVVNPGHKPGCFDCGPATQLETLLANAWLLVQGRDYAEAACWLKDFEAMARKLPPGAVSPATRASMGDLRAMLDRQTTGRAPGKTAPDASRSGEALYGN